MDNNEIISSLAAELTRIGKMPCGDMTIEWDGPECPYLKRHDWHHPENGRVEGVFLTAAKDVILFALLGVAAEAIATKLGWNGNIYSEEATTYERGPYSWSDDIKTVKIIWFPGCCETYPEAVIAALKQIEKEEEK